MTNSGKLFSNELTNWLIDEAGFNQAKWKISAHYKYAHDSSNLVLLSYVDECVYLYTYEELGKWYVDTLGKIFHLKLLGYAHCFMSIRISQLKDDYISTDQDRYTTSDVAKYLYTATIKDNSKFHKTNLPNYMIFNK